MENNSENKETPSKRKTIPYFNVCAAMCNNRGIGLKNGLPWPYLKGDDEYYKSLTSTSKTPGKICARIIGRLTWVSVDSTERSKFNTFNIVISKENRSLLKKDSNVHAVAGSFQEALDVATDKLDDIDSIWILGGQRIYEESVDHPFCQRIYLTKIYADFESDTYIPVFEQNYREIRDPEVDGSLQEENGIKYQFKVYEHIKS